MLHVTESKSKGLTFSVDSHRKALIDILDALLMAAGVMFVKTQNDQWYVHFKVESKDSAAVRMLITAWYQATSDLQYATDTRNHTQ
jgi:ABC-type enterochelin transport system permease subunit